MLYFIDGFRMAKLTNIKRSFNAGELDERMDSRKDQEKYAAGCKTLENYIPLIYGGAQRRSGLEFIAAQKSSSAKGRVEAFEHSVDDTYILLFENQVLRFFKNGAQVFAPFGTEDLSSIGSIVAHWKCNDNAANNTVIDADGATHNGIATVQTNTISTTDAEGLSNAAFDPVRFTVTQHPDFEFGDGTDDSPFSVAVWADYQEDGGDQILVRKGFEAEWRLRMITGGKVRFSIYDDDVNADHTVTTQDGTADGWRFIVVTYDGRGGTNAHLGIKIYVDWVAVATSSVSTGTYVAMEDTPNNDIVVGPDWEGKIDNIAVFSKELTAVEVASLTGNNSTTAAEISTPYLTADLFALKFEQSADVMFITHPDYEPRKLSRLGDVSWILEESNLQTGPFRDQNTETGKTITASATTGSVTLTAIGHSPFVSGTTAGHLPSGSVITSKSLTGALFKLVQAVSGTDQSIGETLNSTTADAVTTTLTVPKGVTWDWTTNGTWGTGGPSALVLERSYDNETTYETVANVSSLANKNITTSGTEEFDDAIYRTRVLDGSGTGTAEIQFSIRDTSHIGIVEITAVASGQSATATVLTTLASTDPTHRWSEGSFSNRRGWPIDVSISSEERLTFTGNVSEPLTVWGSVIADFTDFALGNNDDDAIQFTLVGSGQQNRIRWVVAKDAMILGTVGGEHLLGASKNEEALTPTNVKAKLQTTYGSEDVAAKIVNQAVLFLQRGGKKIREFLYNFEADAHKADDLTVFAGQVTGDGIVDMAFQRTPDPILWCVRTDGQLAIMNYERDQNVFSWARMFTTDSTANSVIESVAVIYGGTRSEDEVWVSILRQINSSDSRTIERFTQRELPSSASNWKFLDSYYTYTGATTTATGGSHLIGEAVQVLGDGVVQTEATAGDFTVDGSGEITLPAAFTTVQIGLGYTSTLVPMDIDLEGLGLAVTTRINKTYVNVHDTVGVKIGPDTSHLKDVVTGTDKVTGFRAVSIPGGYARDTTVTVQQTLPLPATILSLTHDIGGSKD